jgi:DNA-binding NarL/FixJ family response regulator
MQLSDARVRLLLADDKSEFLQEIYALLSHEFDVIATAENGARLILAAQAVNPDIIVTDLSMPELNGIEAGRRILELGYCRKVLILSVMKNPEIVKSALEAGIIGYVLKEKAGEELVAAIRSALDGKAFVSPDIRSHQIGGTHNPDTYPPGPCC